MTDVVFEFTQPKGSGNKDIALTDGFIDALFSISEKIHTSEKFRTRNNGSSRLVWHVTEADLMLMVTLHVCFNSEGKIQNVSRHQIYKKLNELYEDPCCVDQFYIAFEKFIKLGLIHEKVTGVISEFTINHFINPDTNKISRLVVVNPFVYTKNFTDLPISAQKFVFDLLRKQGNEKGKGVFFWLNKDNGIMKQLHKRNIYEIKNLLVLLSNEHITEEPLIKRWHIEPKRGSTSAKLTCVLSDSYTSQYIPGTQYRDVLQGKRTHRRIILHLQNLLSENLIGEFELLNNGRDFFQLVRMLRGKSFRYIRYVVEKIRELYEKNRTFPTDILEFIKDEMRHKGMVTYLEIAKNNGIYKFICPSKLDEERLFEFAAVASNFSQRVFGKMCKNVLPVLEQRYSRPAAYDHSDYAKKHVLDKYIDTLTLRNYAYSLKKCPFSYHELEHQATIRLDSGEEPRDVRLWMLKRIETLPSWSLVPDLPPDFKVEDFIIENQCA